MQVLNFNATIEVFLKSGSSMTMDEIARNVEKEICMGADIPQDRCVVEYAVQEINVTFSGAGKYLPDDFDEYGYDENYNWVGEGDEPQYNGSINASQ